VVRSAVSPPASQSTPTVEVKVLLGPSNRSPYRKVDDLHREFPVHGGKKKKNPVLIPTDITWEI
jgi:hypothetical protein